MALSINILQQAEYRHSAYYLTQLRVVSDLYAQGGSHIQSAITKLETDWFQIQKGHSWAVDGMQTEDAEAVTLCNQYPLVGKDMLERRQTLTERIHWLLMGLEAARKLGNEESVISHLNRLGSTYLDVGDLQNADKVYSEGLDLARASETDPVREIYLRMYLGLANVYIRRGEHAKAIEMDEEIIRQSEQHNFPYGIICANSNLGTIHFVRGEYEKSLHYGEISLKHGREHNEQHRVSISLNNIAGVYWNQGDLDKAKAYYKESLAIRRQLHDQRGIASSVNNLGAIAAMQGDFTLANTYWEEGLNIAQKLGVKILIAHLLNNLGSANRDMKQFADSKRYFNECLAITREIGNHRLSADTLCNVAFMHISLLDLETAKESALEAIQLAREANLKPQLLWAMTAIAQLRYLDGNLDSSAQLLGTISADPLHTDINVKRDFESLQADLSTRLGEETLQLHMENGQQADFNETVKSLLDKISPNS